jgi:hypothetical protein
MGGKAHFMYAVNVEAPRPEPVRHTHLLSYLRKLATRGGKEHFMYSVTAETPRSGQTRYTLFRSYCESLAMCQARQALYIVTVET